MKTMHRPIEQSLPEKCEWMLQHGSWLPESGTIVVGVSGGADSICLMHVLSVLREKYSYGLLAAHVNHGIRGEEALRDAEFVEAFCKLLGVPFRLLNADCPKEAAQRGEGLEEAGRRIRYEFFQSLCQSENDRIATAHTADDNAETVLFRLARGTSLKGAGGIPPVRENIIRPLLNCTRSEVEAYLEANGLSFVTDSTNNSDAYARNRIRHHVLPELSGIYPTAVQAISRFACSAREDDDCLEELSREVLRQAAFPDGSLDAALLAAKHPALRKRVLRLAISRQTAHPLSAERLQAAESCLVNGGRTQLSETLFLTVRDEKLRILREAPTPVPPPEPVTLTPPFAEDFGVYRVQMTLYTNRSKKIHGNRLDNLIDCDTIHGNLVLRTRAPGDRFSFAARGVTKSLKKLFNEEGIPPCERTELPVLADEDGVVWVYGFGTNAGNRPTADSVRVYYVEGEKI